MAEESGGDTQVRMQSAGRGVTAGKLVWSEEFLFSFSLYSTCWPSFSFLLFFPK